MKQKCYFINNRYIEEIDLMSMQVDGAYDDYYYIDDRIIGNDDDDDCINDDRDNDDRDNDDGNYEYKGDVDDGFVSVLKEIRCKYVKSCIIAYLNINSLKKKHY